MIPAAIIFKKLTYFGRLPDFGKDICDIGSKIREFRI